MISYSKPIFNSKLLPVCNILRDDWILWIVNLEPDDVHGFQSLRDIVKYKVTVLHQLKVSRFILRSKTFI